MRRKFLSVVLCVCMMLTMAPFAFAAGEDIGTPESVVAKIGDQEYGTLQAAITAAEDTQTVTLLSDINIARTVSVFNKTITLDMNGHRLHNATDLWDQPSQDDNNWSLISVRGTGNLTITGNGTLQAKENDCYAVDVQDGATLTIENGIFNGNIHAVYVYKGTAYIKGGTYSVQQKYPDTAKAYEFVLNCFDAYRKNDTAKIFVTGGTFANFNPADCQAEGAHTNFCPEGYSTKQEGENYTVMGPVAAIGEHNYATVAAAVEAANNDTVTLLKDVTESVVIPTDKTVTLDLNGKKLTNVNNHTITNNGTLTITGTGTVDNVTHGKAAIYNKVTATCNLNGNIVYCRSAEASTSADNSGKNSYYVIDNYGTMNINRGTFKFSDTNPGAFSSLIHNGWYNGKQNTSGQQATMTIKDGNFTQGTGGLITVKNDDYGNLTIEGGVFTQPERNHYCVFNYHNAVISGGTINGHVGNEFANNNSDLGYLDIKGDVTITGNIYNTTNNNTTSNESSNLVKISDNAKIGGTIITNKTENVRILGGYFTTDPSAYCADGKTGVATGKADYPYTVGDKKTDSQPATVDSATVPANTTSTDATVIAAANSISGASVTNNNATEAATRDIANNNTITATTEIEVGSQKKTVTNALSDAMSEGSTNKPSETNPVAIVYQTYVDVTVTDAKKDSNNSLTELTVDLTPMYRVVATTKSVAESTSTEIKLAGDSVTGANAIQIGEAKELNVPAQAYEVTLALPSGFAIDGAKLSIKHTKENGSIEYYTGTVSTEGEEDAAKTYVTFTTNGFSPFVIYAASANVASIGDGANKKVYPTLQAAIDAVQNNETITLLKDTNENVTVSKAIKFTLAGKDHLKGSIAAGSRYSMTTSETTSGNTEYTFTSVGGGSSSSISTPTTYAVNVNAATNGAVAADKKTASKGTTVTVTASPSKGYVVDAVKVVDKDGKDVAVTGKDGKYVFTMPASAVTVTGSFKAETPAPVALPFTDVKSGNWFYDAVKYAYEQGLMTGTSATTFAPNGTMNRAMIVTVLYRLEKSPAVTGASKFTDVPAGQWYSDAVAWAAANKIVNGYDETTFGPMNAVTREQMAAILFRYEQVKGLENVTLEENLNRFPDQNKISAYAIPALQWAVGQKIINGNADGTLDPTGTATRAQVAQIFTNLLNK